MARRVIFVTAELVGHASSKCGLIHVLVTAFKTPSPGHRDPKKGPGERISSRAIANPASDGLLTPLSEQSHARGRVWHLGSIDQSAPDNNMSYKNLALNFG